MLLISVPSYEEQSDSGGNLVTYYIVCIEDTITHLKYSIVKRYSAFSTLRDQLKDKYPGMESFRFPHKSMFHTHSQFTKERRRQGFDDFLKIISTIRPMPAEFEEFLELKHHIEKYEKVVRANVNYNNHSNPSSQKISATTATPVISSSTTSSSSSSLTTTATTATVSTLSTVQSSTKSNQSNQSMANPPIKTKGQVDPYNREPQLLHLHPGQKSLFLTKDSNLATLSEQEILLEIRKITPQLLKSTYSWVMGVYLFLIYFKILDISSSSFARMVLTVLSLGCVICFIRIVLIRRELLHSKEDGNSNAIQSVK